MATEKILVVEDDAIIAMRLENTLSNWGYTVSVVDSGEEAVEQSTVTQPHLVLMDVRLAGEMDGVEAASQIRRQMALPIVFLTAYADDELMARAKLAEPYGYLIKPLQERELRSALEIALYKHRTDEKLRQSEQRYRELSELISDMAAAFRVLPDGRLVAEWATRSYDEFVGANTSNGSPPGGWLSLVHPDDRAEVVETLRPLLDKPTTRLLVFRVCGGDGECRWLQHFGRSLWDEAEQRVTRLLVSVHDVSGQKRTEMALQESDARYRTLFEGNVYPTIIYDADARIVLINSAGAAKLGVAPEDCVGKLLQEFMPDYYELVLPRFKQVIETGQQMRKEDLVDLPGGQRRWYLSIIQPLANAAGQRYAVQVISYDITERKQAEMALERERALLARRVEERTAELRQTNAELARATRLKDEFLASMSHELRTPLNAILGMAEILQEKIYGPLTAQQLKSVRYIEEGGNHLLELINDILDVSKIEAGRFELDMGLVSVEDVCTASMRFIKQLAQKKQIKTYTTFDKTVTVLRADERRLKQILVNLLNNAVKFTPEGGKIGLEVAGHDAENVIQFIVWDTGIGISEAEMEHIFQPFMQLDRKLSREYEGSGLGLALVANLAELHGGSIWLESTVGQGSRFTVALPWNKGRIDGEETDANLQQPPDPEQKTTTSPVTVAETPANHPLILLAEDNATNIATMQGFLSHKYEIEIAPDGAAALEKARAIQPDLILMDIQMPVMDGLEAIRQIRADPDLSDIPIIALTALAMPGDRAKCLAAGANDYLSKPAGLKALHTLIERHLAGG